MITKYKDWAINQSLNHPIRTIIISVTISIFISFGIQWLVIEDNMMKILPKKDKTVKTWESIKEEFGSTDMMFIAFGKRGETAFNAEQLGLLWDICKELETINDIDEVISISTSSRIDGVEGYLQINDLQPQRSLSQNEINILDDYLKENIDIGKRLVSKDRDYLNIIIKPLPNIDVDTFSNNVVKIANNYLSNYEIHFGGQIYLMGTIPGIIRSDIGILILVGLTIMFIILLSSLRNISAVLMNFVVITLSFFVMLGFMGWVYRLTGSDKFLFSLLNTSMPLILLTIANSDGVHVITKFFSKMRVIQDVKESIFITMDSLLLPIFLTSLTTVLAFLSMTFAPLQQMVGYGVAISVGILWAWLMSSLLLPSMLYLKNWKLDSNAIIHASIIERVTNYIGKGITRSPKIIISIIVVVIGIGAFGINQLNIEVNMLTFFKDGNQTKESMIFLDGEMVGTMDIEFRIEGDIKDPNTLRNMENIQNHLHKHPKVATSFSIVDVIKKMHQAIEENDPKFNFIPDSRNKINNLITLYLLTANPDDLESLVDYNYETAVITALMQTVSTKEITKFVNEVEYFINNEIDDELAITNTGMLVVFRDLTNKLINSSFTSIIVSIILICLVASLFFGNMRWGLISIVPLTSSVILVFGIMGWTNVKFNHITLILSSVIIGVGVDFAIHYISQFKRILYKKDEQGTISKTVISNVGYPIILDSLSNMSFGAMLVSTFIPIQHIGGLMMLAMITTLLGTLSIMASLIELQKNKLN